MGPLGHLHPLSSTTRKILPLENGDRLTRVEFERRYGAMPKGRKAELIDGVVYMASPTKLSHGAPHALLLGWLTTYTLETPGTQTASDTTLRLDEVSQPQPDALLRIIS